MEISMVWNSHRIRCHLSTLMQCWRQRIFLIISLNIIYFLWCGLCRGEEVLQAISFLERKMIIHNGMIRPKITLVVISLGRKIGLIRSSPGTISSWMMKIYFQEDIFLRKLARWWIRIEVTMLISLVPGMKNQFLFQDITLCNIVMYMRTPLYIQNYR